jgi:hypothetical protein
MKHISEPKYTPAQILDGVREVWVVLLGFETSFSATPLPKEERNLRRITLAADALHAGFIHWSGARTRFLRQRTQ